MVPKPPIQLVVGLLLIAVLALNWSTALDEMAEAYLNDAITDNLLVYATARSLNAIISVIQSIELSVSLGAGVAIHFGEILDPLNDLIERFSGFILYGLAGLGLQKLVLVATASLPMKIVSSVALLLGFCWFIWKGALQVWLLRLLVLMLLVRFAFIIEVGVIAALDAVYFDQEVDRAHSVLQLAKSNLSNLREDYIAAIADKGLYGGLWEAVESIVGTDEQDGIANLAAGAVVDLIVVTLVRGMVLPFLFLWMLLIAARWLFTPATSFSPTQKGIGSTT